MSTITNLNRIRLALIVSISEMVGEELGKILLNGTDEVPAVIEDITGGNHPPTPFIVVGNSITTGLQGTKILDQYVRPSGELVIKSLHYATFNVKCWGDNSLAILTDLVVKINHATTRWKLEQDAHASFLAFSSPQYIPTYLSTEFVETSEMDVKMSFITEYVPADGTYIEQIGAIGTVNDGT